MHTELPVHDVVIAGAGPAVAENCDLDFSGIDTLLNQNPRSVVECRRNGRRELRRRLL